MRRPSFPRLCSVVATVVIALVAFVGLTDGYGADSGRTALAISGTEDVGFSADLRLVTECADEVTVEVARDPAGSGLALVTVWGRPRVGRCRAPAYVTSFELQGQSAAGQTEPVRKFVDGATGFVVDIS